MSILFTIIIAVLFARIDADFLNTGYRFVSHNSRFILRAMVVLAISVYDWKLLLLNTVIFVFLFDYTLNLFRHLPILHQGTTANWDKFWSVQSPYLQLAVKIIFLITSIIIYTL